MKGLTVKQQQIYDFICQHQEERGYPPTIREIGINFNLNSTGSVRDYLHALEKKGFINRNLRTSRGIEILKKTIIAKTRSIPIYGSIAAGAPTVAAQQSYDEEVIVDSAWFGNDSETFSLRVQGESMIDAGILDGDLVVVRKQDYANDGDIVAVVIDDDATVKYFYREGNRIRFQPANEGMEPIFMEENKAQLHISGKVVGIMRKY